MISWKQIESARAILERETGAVIRDPGGRLTVALAYPNTYYVGMSSLALHILYRQFNSAPGVACERVFWDEAAARAGQPLRSLETQRPVQEFAVWAFTISFEMDYFNVVAMLRQAGVPALAEERETGQWPLLIAGGPAVTANPEPMAPFFDAILLGEAEEGLDSLTQAMREGVQGNRQDLLDALAKLPGIYVPSRTVPGPGTPPVERLWVRDPGCLEPVSALNTPDTEFGGMHLIEIARGCGRGCRYCLAGFLYRPVREQPLSRILGWARAALQRAQSEGRQPPGIGLVSAAVSDHSQIDDLAEQLQAMGARISVSSMRTDPISVPLVQAMVRSGTQTLTIAPEAGSERLRAAINKPQGEDSLLAAAELAQQLGFRQLKLYFMIGHPGEEEADIEAIVDLTLKAKAVFKRGIAINATPFVPKAHTPFERVAMAPVRELQARQAHLKRRLGRHRVDVRADSPQWAAVQGVLARGDRRLAPVLLDTAEDGIAGFRDAMARHGLMMDPYLGERASDVYLPWHIVDTGVEERYQDRERRLAGQSRPGYRCPPAEIACRACGVCGGRRPPGAVLTAEGLSLIDAETERSIS